MVSAVVGNRRCHLNARRLAVPASGFLTADAGHPNKLRNDSGQRAAGSDSGLVGHHLHAAQPMALTAATTFDNFRQRQPAG